MTMTSANQAKFQLQLDESCAAHIPYARFVDAETIETKNGNLIQVIKVDGLLAEAMDDELINIEKHIRQSLIMSLTDSTTSFYFHTIRQKANTAMKGIYGNDFLQSLHDKWQKKIGSRDYYVNEHYITIIKKPPVGKIRRFSDLLKSLTSVFDREERERFRQDTLNELQKISRQILTTLAHYGVKKLCNSPATKTGIPSESLSFLASLINLETRDLIAPPSDLSSNMAYKRLFFDSTRGMIALRGVNNTVSYAAILAIKNYSHVTQAGMLDKLLDIKAEIILAQSFSPIEKESIRNKVKEAQRNQAQSDDGQTSASDKISEVLDEVGSSEATLGEHQLMLLCKADTLARLETTVAEIDAALNQIGVIALREDVGVQPAFFSILPGNFPYLTRKALVLSKNMASLASLHNTSRGKEKGNYWGQAVTVLETISGSPYYFNFHVMDVANTFMIGPQGSGKTLLQAFLLGQSMKMGGRLVVLDKDRGLEIFVRAQGGSYSLLTAGKRTGFAPFQMEDTEDNRYFLFKLLRKIAMLSGAVPDSEMDEQLNFAINGAFHLSQEERVLRNIVAFLGMRKAGSLRSYFNNWVNDGTFAWIFDNDIDDLSLDHPVIGFDMTSVLADELTSSVIYYYLFYRIENLIDSTPMRIVGAEAWRALHDEEFMEKIRDWSSTPRKKNAFLVLDTQAPNDIAGSDIGCKIIQETVTQIYFANPTASYEDYVVKFKLTEKEYLIIKSLNKESRFFLLKQGKHSVVLRADLRGGFEDEIAALSGYSDSVKLLDEIRAVRGDAPADWLPEFYQKVKELSKHRGA
jgi:type IV secretion system protein VirB4